MYAYCDLLCQFVPQALPETQMAQTKPTLEQRLRGKDWNGLQVDMGHQMAQLKLGGEKAIKMEPPQKRNTAFP